MIASSDSASAAETNPAARSAATPSGHGSIRVHGTWNTVPIDTRTERRYSGSAQRGVTSTASTPSAAADRNAAPTLVWSTMSSSTATRRAPASTSATAGRGGRCIAASAPRCTWKPVIASSTGSSATYTVIGSRSSSCAGSAATMRSRSGTQRGASSTERGRCPARSARSSTVELSAM